MNSVGQKVNLILSSPPYNIGKEYENKTALQSYLEWQKELIKEYYEVLTNDGTLVYQVGNFVDKGKVYPLDCLLFTCFIEQGFIPRNRIVWTFGHGLHCSKRLSGRHETLMVFTKSEKYTFNLDDIRIPQKNPNKRYYKGPKKGQLSGNPLGKNPGDTWDISNVKNNHPEKTTHPCQYPLELVKRVIKAYSNPKDTILDPFMGSFTTACGAADLGRHFLGFELMPEYIEIGKKRLKEYQSTRLLAEVN